MATLPFPNQLLISSSLIPSTEGNLKINVNIKKKNLELLEAKKKGGDVAGLGVDGGNNDLLLQTMGGAGGGTGGCGSGDDAKKDDMEDKFRSED